MSEPGANQAYRRVFTVTVENLATGEKRVHELASISARDAMVEALSHAFHEWGWRRTLAQWPPAVKEVALA